MIFKIAANDYIIFSRSEQAKAQRETVIHKRKSWKGPTYPRTQIKEKKNIQPSVSNQKSFRLTIISTNDHRTSTFEGREKKKRMLIEDQLLNALLPNPQFEDDLNVILDWLQPYEHQLQPPSLRIKNSIKRLTGANLSAEFMRRFNEFYLVQVRSQYTAFMEEREFSSEKTIEFDELCKLENKLLFPCRYLQSLLDEKIVWDNIKNLRHYFIDRSLKFRRQLSDLLRNQVLERISSLSPSDNDNSKNNNEDTLIKLINWIDSSNSSFLSSKDLLMDILLEQIQETCNQRIRGHWTTSSSITSSYNDFLHSKFQHIVGLLGFSPDDQRLLSTVFHAFQLQFISIRIPEALDIFVTHFPKSKPAVIELNAVLRQHRDNYEQFMARLSSKFLIDFKREFLNPSVRILEALLGFLRSVKCFMYLEPSGKRVRLITDELKSRFQSHRELMKTLLYAMLDLKSEEYGELGIVPVAGIDRLSQELRVNEFEENVGWFDTIETSLDDMGSEGSSVSENDDLEISVSDIDNPKGTNARLNYEIILQQYLMWIPDNKFVIVPPGETQEKVNLLDILLQMLGNRRDFVDEFVRLLGNKLLHLTSSYVLDDNWLDCLGIIRDKFTNANKMVVHGVGSQLNGINDDGAPIMEGNGTDDDNDDDYDDDDDDNYHTSMDDSSVEEDMGTSSGRGGEVNVEGLYQVQLNKIDVMLHDMKNSEMLQDKITKLVGGTLRGNPIEMYPKFLTPLYWDIEEGQEIDKLPTSRNRYLTFDSSSVSDAVLACAYGHTLVNPDQALRYLEDKSTVEIQIDSTTLPPLVLTVTMLQYCVLEKFSSPGVGKARFTVEEIVNRCNISRTEAETALQFWTKNGVLSFDGSFYHSCE